LSENTLTVKRKTLTVEVTERQNIVDFRDLDAWKLCRDLRLHVWSVCQGFPSEEKFRLADQMVRASRSATACIAEGYGRFHYQENIQFCRQSRGSLYELIDHFLVAHECGYTTDAAINDLIEKTKRAIQTVNGYIRHLKKQKNPNSKLGNQ
jgi:four helix bundle protein